MGIAETFQALQAAPIAIPVCTATVMGVAYALKKPRTATLLAVALAAELIHFYVAALPDVPIAGGLTMPVVALLALVTAFAVTAVREGAWTAIYVALMPIINWSFSAVPTAPIPSALGGGQFQPLAIVTGLVMVVRDFAQIEIRHWIFSAMALGLALSTLTSWITVVFASGAAFLISETVDWAFYTFSNKPFSQRVMISSAASAPLDQIVFIWLASFVVPGIFAVGTVVTGILSKLLGAWVVSQIMARRERRLANATQMKPS